MPEELNAHEYGSFVEKSEGKRQLWITAWMGG
jgi:hypothetical protein